MVTQAETHTIPRSGWKQFFNSLSRIYQGERASLEILRPDAGAQFEVEDQPFAGASYDSSGIELNFTIRGGHFGHRIAQPRSVQIEENEAGLAAAINIDSDDDPRAVLHLHAPQASKLLTAGTE